MSQADMNAYWRGVVKKHDRERAFRSAVVSLIVKEMPELAQNAPHCMSGATIQSGGQSHNGTSFLSYRTDRKQGLRVFLSDKLNFFYVAHVRCSVGDKAAHFGPAYSETVLETSENKWLKRPAMRSLLRGAVKDYKRALA